MSYAGCSAITSELKHYKSYVSIHIYRYVIYILYVCIYTSFIHIGVCIHTYKPIKKKKKKDRIVVSIYRVLYNAVVQSISNTKLK